MNEKERNKDRSGKRLLKLSLDLLIKIQDIFFIK